MPGAPSVPGHTAPALDADVVERVRRAVDARAPETIELLSRLVSIDSTNPSYAAARPEARGGEGRCNELLSEWHERSGLQLHQVEVARGRPNLVAVRPGGGGGRSLLLNAHVDTVPPASLGDWRTDPWTPTVVDGAMHGLGAADMKGGAAAMWCAATALRDAGIELAGDLQLHTVCGEEAMEHEIGTSACVRAGFAADAGIVTEPSSAADPLTVAAASPGYRHLRVRVAGASTHHGNRASAIRVGGRGEEIGVNALEKAVDVVRHLQELERQWGMRKRHPYFAPGSFTIFPGRLRAEPSQQLPVPVYFLDEALIEYGIWYPPDQGGDEIAAEVQAFLRDACATDPWLRSYPPALEWGLDWPPALLEWEHPLVAALAGARTTVLGERTVAPSPRHPASIGASTDATWLVGAGIPAAVLGPGRIELAHSPDERVALPEVVAAAKVLALCAIAWCGQAAS